MIVGVVGTGTEVGKTWVTVALARQIAATGSSVQTRKPAQSFDPDDPGPRDADLLGAATGATPEAVCPRHRWYEVAMAPPIAAHVLGRPPFTVADLATEVAASIVPEALTFVETAGGVRSPIAADGDCLDFLAALGVDRLLLVADAGLGTINLVRLTLDAIAGSLTGRPVTVHLNRFVATDTVHETNRAWLATHVGPPTTDLASLARTYS